MAAAFPSPKTTLVILLGASSWPFSPEFQASKAFHNSALEVRDYFLNPSQFSLPHQNLLNLFNSDQSADDIDGEIGLFIARRMTEMKQAGEAARDLIVYFIGHGGFVGNDSDYYLAIRRTRSDNPSVSGIRMVSLAYTLKEKARSLRRIIILDCCFAGAAFLAFQSGPAQTAIIQTVDAFKAPGKGTGVPERGTSLLCSSGHKTPSLISQDGTHTLFSKALVQALSAGNPQQQRNLSLHDIADLTVDALHALQEKSIPRPEVHSPDQAAGNVAEVPLFPNLAAGTIKASQNVVAPSLTGKSTQVNPLPSLVLPAATVGPLPYQPKHTPPRQGLSRSKVVLLIGLAILMIVGGIGLFNLIETNQVATNNAYSTATASVKTALAQTNIAEATTNTIRANASATSQAVAATSIAIADPRTPYAAPVPGPCDKGGARWQFANGDNTSYNCLSDSMRLVATNSNNYMYFYGRTQFPQNYAIAVEVFNLTAGCASIIARGTNHKGAYRFTVCQDGSWMIGKIIGSFTLVTLNSGTIASHNSFKMTATCSGSTQTLTIDDIRIGASNDTTYTTTDFTALVLSSSGQVSASANFKNFQYTPLA